MARTIKTAGLFLPVVIGGRLGLIFSLQPSKQWTTNASRTKIFYNFIGGKLERGEDYAVAAAREAHEELGSKQPLITADISYRIDINNETFTVENVQENPPGIRPFLEVHDHTPSFLARGDEIVCQLFLGTLKRIPLYSPVESAGILFLPLEYFSSDGDGELSLDALKSIGAILQPMGMIPDNVALESLFNKRAIARMLQEERFLNALRGVAVNLPEVFLMRDEEIIRFYPCDLNKMHGEDILRNRTAPMARAMYIHIPFCDRFCNFCCFNKIAPLPQLVERYLDCLEKEFDLYAGTFSAEARNRIEAVWVGGGTPFILSVPQLERLLKKIREVFVLKNAEITVETTPAALNKSKIEAAAKSGVHRLSMGIQSFHEKYLAMTNRPPLPPDLLDSLGTLKANGLKFNVDLMYRLPGETLDEWKEDLERTVQIGADHISCFPLVINKAVPLGMKIRQGLAPPYPSSYCDIQMYELAKSILERGGYRQYTVNHFAKPGSESRYQLSRFPAPQKEIIGFGSGSLSYFNGYSYFNFHNPDHYCVRLEQGGSPVAMGKKITPEDKMAIYMILGFRALKVGKEEFYATFGREIGDVWKDELVCLKDFGFIRESERYWELTPDGENHINNVGKFFFSSPNKIVGQLNAWLIRKDES